VAKDFYRKTKIQEQLTKARLQEPDEFKHREVVESTCFLLDGYVSTNGEAPSIEKEASMLGYEVTEHLRLFEQNRQQEFEARDDKGRLYSPEVLHELHIRKVRSQAGKASAESRLLEQNDEQKGQQKVGQNPNYNYNSDSVSAEGEESNIKGGCASSASDEAFNHWNSLPNVQHHREFSDKARGLVNGRLKTYSLGEVKQTFDTYDAILASSDTLLNTRWTLDQLCQPDRFAKFAPGSDPWTFYKNHNAPESGGARRQRRGRQKKARDFDKHRKPEQDVEPC
jgi:DNA-binding transcriptional MerR regulator